MEKCKFCQAELEENATVCPNCGKDNAQEAVAEVTETDVQTDVPAETVSKPEEKKSAGIVLSPAKVAVLAAVFVALVAVIVGLIVAGSKKEAPAANVPTQTIETTVPEETTPPTIPEGSNNAAEAACKGTYTASAEEVRAAAADVVATAGDLKLTNEQLQIFYWMEVRQFLANYGGYASMMGLDVNVDLDKQNCEMVPNHTWQQYFLERAIGTWGNYSAMAAEADAVGHELSAEFQQILKDIPDDLQKAVESNNLSSIEEMLTTTMGPGATQEAYTNFLTLYYKGYDYYGKEVAAFQPTAEEVEAYFDGHEGDFADDGITKETCTVDVRHILLFPEGADNATVRTEEFPEEAWTAAEAKAQEILDAWKAGKKTEESFAQLANEKSQDGGSNTNGGLYTGVAEGQMVEAFNDWCFDPSRQVGDTDIVRTEYGFHIMYFCGSQTVWQEEAKNALMAELADNFANEILDRYPLAADYSKAVIGAVDMMG